MVLAGCGDDTGGAGDAAGVFCRVVILSDRSLFELCKLVLLPCYQL